MPLAPYTPDPETLRLQFRNSERTTARGTVMAAFTDAHGGTRLARVDLRDESRGGLGLICPLPVRVGSRFTIYARLQPIVEDAGIVTRCIRDKGAYRIGLRRDTRRAA